MASPGFPCKTSDGLPAITNGKYTNTETAVDSKIEVGVRILDHDQYDTYNNMLARP